MYKVFIIDDHSLFCQALEVLINRFENYEVDYIGRNGRELIHRLQDPAFAMPDIILLDVKMPVMDGMSALQIIHSRWPKTQVILLSGHADMQLAVQAMSEGAFGYLMKPVDIDELLFKIEDAVTQVRLEAGQG